MSILYDKFDFKSTKVYYSILSKSDNKTLKEHLYSFYAPNTNIILLNTCEVEKKHDKSHENNIGINKRNFSEKLNKIKIIDLNPLYNKLIEKEEYPDEWDDFIDY